MDFRSRFMDSTMLFSCLGHWPPGRVTFFLRTPRGAIEGSPNLDTPQAHQLYVDWPYAV